MPFLARRLSTFYLGYFGFIGVLLPYLSLYLLDLGLSPYEIGIIAAITPLVKTIAPTLWGWLADRHRMRRPLLRFTAMGAVVCFAGLLFTDTFWGIALVMAIYSLCTSSILPLVESTAMEAAEVRRIDYGRVRLWGSVGFIATSIGMGPVLDRMPSVAVLWVCLALLLFSGFSAWGLPPEADRSVGDRRAGNALTLLTNPQVMGFFLVCMLMQASHGPLYGFLSVHLEALGYSRTAIGALWAVGVAAEVAVMAFSGRLLVRYDTRAMMMVALALAALRWGMLATATSLPWLIGAQLLHAASFGLFHVAAVTHTHRLIPAPLQATGQSLYSSLTFGLGLTFGMYLSGLFYDSDGASALFGTATLVALVALAAATRLQPAPAAPSRPPG